MDQPSRYQQLLAEIRPQIKEINSDQLEQRLQKDINFYLVDVREAREWQKGHIPNAVHISRGVLEPNVEKAIPDPRAEIVVYCGGGGRSALAAFSLQKMGYDNISSLAGGFGQWNQLGKPVKMPENEK